MIKIDEVCFCTKDKNPPSVSQQTVILNILRRIFHGDEEMMEKVGLATDEKYIKFEHYDSRTNESYMVRFRIRQKRRNTPILEVNVNIRNLKVYLPS